MTKLIITSESELEILIQSSLRKVIGEQGNQNKENDSDRYLNIKEASVFLNLAPQTIYQFTSARTIPFIKKGKKLYFSSESLANWLLEGKQKSNVELTDEYNRKERSNG